MIPFLRNILQQCIQYLFTSKVRFRGQILSPSLGDIVDSGIVLSYWLANLCSLALWQAAWYDNPMPQSTVSLSQGLRIWLQCIKKGYTLYSVEENPGFIPPFFKLHPKKGFLYREPEFLSNCLNLGPPTSFPASECGSPQGPGGGGQTRQGGRGRGDPIETTGQTLWYSTNSNPFTLQPTMCRFLDESRPQLVPLSQKKLVKRVGVLPVCNT